MTRRRTAIAASCGVHPDQIFTDGAPLVTVRSDRVAEPWYEDFTSRESRS